MAGREISKQGCVVDEAYAVSFPVSQPLDVSFQYKYLPSTDVFLFRYGFFHLRSYTYICIEITYAAALSPEGRYT